MPRTINNVIADMVVTYIEDIQAQHPRACICAMHINNGYCADFATSIWEEFDRKDVVVCNDEELGGGEYTHTFIQYEDRYYDAECHNGVLDWRELPVFTDPDRTVDWGPWRIV